MNLSPKEVQKQSMAAMSQWGDKWREHAKANGELMRKTGTSQKDIAGEGAGRQLLVCATGASLERHIDMIREHQANADIMCCDKSLGVLIERGIMPKYCVLADASISFEKWLKPWADRTQDIMLIANVNSNPEWTHGWKGPVYFYVNKDNIKTEEIFSKISGCHELIVASSNVGNTCIVFACQVLGYDRYLLVGYDYSWKPDGNYYAFGDNDKRYWMKHHYFLDINGDPCYTSGNLYFSCRWLGDYITAGIQSGHRGIANIFNCSGQGIFDFQIRDLKPYISEPYLRTLTNEEKQSIINARLRDAVSTNDSELKENMKLAVHEVIVRYMKRRPAWLLAG